VTWRETVLRAESGAAGMGKAEVATGATGIFASAGNREVEAAAGLFAVQQDGPSTLGMVEGEAQRLAWQPPMAGPVQQAVSTPAGTANKAMLTTTTANLSARYMP
jgi:hypothetical protein